MGKAENKVLFNTLKAAIILAVLYFLSNNKALILIAIFEILDLGKTFLKTTIEFLPVDLVFIFGITGSYYYSPLIGIIIFLLGLINRLVAVSIEPRHLLKAVRHIPLFFLVSFLGATSFFFAALMMLVLNYIMKYLFNMFQNPLNYYSKSPFHIVNFIISTMFFFLLDTIFDYLRFLR